VAVAALRGRTNERGEFLMTTLPVGSVGSAPAGNSIVLPHFADGAGWSTQVVLTNPTDMPLAGTVQFLDSGSAQTSASPLTMTVNGTTESTFTYTIAPRSAVRLATSNTSTEVRVGSVRVTADQGVTPQGISIFSFANDGITVSEAAVRAEATGTTFRTYVESLGSLHSGLALANPSLSPANVQFELTTVNGAPTGLTASVDIAAGGHAAQFINDLFPALTDDFQGVLTMTSTQPVAVVGLRVRNNERGDLLITAMPVTGDATPATNSDLLFPLVPNGGGYTTEFVRTIRNLARQ
jgi:hypothetical protein